MQKASVTSGIGLGMSRTSSVVDSGGVALIRPCLWTAKKAHQMIKTPRKMSNWCVRLGGPWLKMTLNRIAHILFKFHSNWSVAFKRSVAYGTSVISWGTRFWCGKKYQNMWHCCGIVASLQGQIVESERGMASWFAAVQEVALAAVGSSQGLGGKVFVHGVTGQACASAWFLRSPWIMAVDCYCLSLHSSTAFCIHEPWAKDSNSN